MTKSQSLEEAKTVLLREITAAPLGVEQLEERLLSQSRVDILPFIKIAAWALVDSGRVSIDENWRLVSVNGPR